MAFRGIRAATVCCLELASVTLFVGAVMVWAVALGGAA